MSCVFRAISARSQQLFGQTASVAAIPSFLTTIRIRKYIGPFERKGVIVKDGSDSELKGGIVSLRDKANSYRFTDSLSGALQVTDLSPDSDKSPTKLVFSDGHASPLLCPDCPRLPGQAQPLYIEDTNEFLKSIAGFYFFLT